MLEPTSRTRYLTRFVESEGRVITMRFFQRLFTDEDGLVYWEDEGEGAVVESALDSHIPKEDN